MNRRPLEDVRQYLGIIHKRRILVGSSVGACLLGALLYNYTARPLFQATTQILIEPVTPDVLPAKELLPVGQGARDYYETEYQLIQSRGLAEKVVERLKLHEKAEFETGALLSPWERLQRWLGRETEPVASGLPLSPAAAAFQSRLRVDPMPGSRLVKLRFHAYDPELAAAAVNTLAQLYIEQSLEFHYATSSEATGWLSERLAEQQAKARSAERALQDYREKQDLVRVEDGASLIDQKLSTLTSALVAARTDRLAKETLHRKMAAATHEELSTFPAVLGSPAVAAIKAQLAELHDEEHRLQESLGDKHPQMVRLQADVAQREKKLALEVENIRRAAATDYETARTHEESLQSSFEAAKKEALSVTRKGIEFGLLKRELDSSQRLLQELLTRSKETGLETQLQSTNIRVVDKATVPEIPVAPARGRNYQIALLLGIALGVGLAILLEHVDSSFKTPEDVKMHLGLPLLGMIADVERKRNGGGGMLAPRLHASQLHSPVAESYRVLRTNLIFSFPEASGRVLVVSSACPGEGKSTTVANLAYSLAQNGSKVLVVDADLRRPTMHQHFHVEKTPGLSDLIVGNCTPSQAIHATDLKGLQVIPCGYVPPNPTELLGSANMREILGALRTLCDWVLIDTPPILTMADTPVLCPFTDGLVLVVGAELSNRATVQRALDQVLTVGGKVTGVVLNKVDLERNSYYYSQHYGEYYRSYYAEKPESRPT